MNVPADLDRSFRQAADRAGLVDVGFGVTESPVGELLVAATERGLCAVAFDPTAALDELARRFGPRVLELPRRVDRARRQLDRYFEGRLREFTIDVDLSPLPDFQRRVLEELARVPFGELTTYGALAARIGRPRAARAVGGALNRNPVAIVLPCHRVVGSSGSLVGYAGGLELKATLLRHEGLTLG